MKTEATPWSVPVRLAEIGTGFADRIEADDAVKARVAKALGIPEIKRLPVFSFSVILSLRGGR